MLDKVFDHPDLHTALFIIAKTLVIYIFLVVGLRLLGKRELGQMNIYDLVMIVVLGNAVQNAMIDNDNTLAGGLISATTLLLVNRLLNLGIVHWKKAEKVMVGEPSLIWTDGHFVENTMRKEGITREQVMEALREHGFNNIEDAKMCVLEVDGTISVLPRGAETFRSRRHYRALRLP